MIVYLFSVIFIIGHNNVALASLSQNEYGPYSDVNIFGYSDDRIGIIETDINIDTTDDDDLIGWYIKTGVDTYTQITDTWHYYWYYYTDPATFSGSGSISIDMRLCKENPCGTGDQFGPFSDVNIVRYSDNRIALMSTDIDIGTTDEGALVGWYIVQNDDTYTKITEKWQSWWYYNTNPATFSNNRGDVALTLCRTNPCPSDQAPSPTTPSPTTPSPTTPNPTTPNPTTPSPTTPSPTTPSPTEASCDTTELCDAMNIIDQNTRKITGLQRRVSNLESASSAPSPTLFLNFDKDLLIICLLIINVITIIVFSYCYCRSMKKTQYSSLKIYSSETEDEENRRFKK